MPPICTRSTDRRGRSRLRRGVGDRARRGIRGAAVLAFGLALIVALGLAGPGGASEHEPAAAGSEGRDLFLSDCAICHGTDGRGAPPGPAIADLGAAASHLQITTGRMPPPDDPLVQPPPDYTAEQARAIAEYAGTLGDGPEIPEVTPERGEPAIGSELYHQNCGACHGPTGRGALMVSGLQAPDLGGSDATQLAEAILTGPGEMPSFRGVFDRPETDAIVRHVLEERGEGRGGLPLGHFGPFLEGLFAILIGLGAIVLIIRFGVAR